MDTLQKEVYDAKYPISRIATKASVKLISQNDPTRDIYQGRYVLEPWSSTSRGTYGGDLITQGLNAAWESVINRSPQDDGVQFQPHSLHTYFVKAGSTESVMKWEVIKISDSRNFANRCVLGYQSHNDLLVVTIQVSFTKDNNLINKQRQFDQQVAQGVTPKSWPLVFKRHPGPSFYKYRDNLHDLQHRTLYYSGHLTHGVPKEMFESSENFNLDTTGNEERGFFVKINDDLAAGVQGYSGASANGVNSSPSQADLTRRKYLALTYASDAFWASTFIKALGLPLGTTKAANVSLDHTLYFHDSNFTLGTTTNGDSNWLYLETQFVSMGNNRLLAIVNFYTVEGEGTLVATAVQELYGFLPKEVADKSRQLHEKHNASKSQLSVAKL
ncbi:hypothetical protein CANMA_004813 [Candida margitis]|uniref:uncharacterized protein n=1 Tax=Candida margitis TaxID=1775924 RepID=UPI002225D981|nr:uncharacterized protein CANMA_004813 [Candida margitis]KAI5953974.1 hypothetical protein CANMA_004813 [Candida margitis]